MGCAMRDQQLLSHSEAWIVKGFMDVKRDERWLRFSEIWRHLKDLQPTEYPASVAQDEHIRADDDDPSRATAAWILTVMLATRGCF